MKLMNEPMNKSMNKPVNKVSCARCGNKYVDVIWVTPTGLGFCTRKCLEDTIDRFTYDLEFDEQGIFHKHIPVPYFPYGFDGRLACHMWDKVEKETDEEKKKEYLKSYNSYCEHDGYTFRDD